VPPVFAAPPETLAPPAETLASTYRPGGLPLPQPIEIVELASATRTNSRALRIVFMASSGMPDILAWN
jgi:hypothetical protein